MDAAIKRLLSLKVLRARFPGSVNSSSESLDRAMFSLEEDVPSRPMAEAVISSSE